MHEKDDQVEQVADLPETGVGLEGFTPSNIWNRVRMRRGPDAAVRHGRDPARHQLGHGRRAEHLQAAGD